MALINVKGLKESDGKVFKAFDAGVYHVRISNVETRKAKETSKHPGSMYLNFTTKILDGDRTGQSIFFMCTLPAEYMDEEQVRKSVAKLRHIADICGLNVDSDNFDTQDFISCELNLSLIKKTKDGVEVNEVKDYLKVD